MDILVRLETRMLTDGQQARGSAQDNLRMPLRQDA